MVRRFEIRKREIEQDTKLNQTDICGTTLRLECYLEPYFRGLPRSGTRENATSKNILYEENTQDSTMTKQKIDYQKDSQINVSKLHCTTSVISLYFSGIFIVRSVRLSIRGV
ncbi:MAG: hypothetical protein LBH59_08960 [Planctomycetaceae bacterium]|jgi:hypothetical protein|nr:hypothetical protein [Planctomycetaceae bacterium]